MKFFKQEEKVVAEPRQYEGTVKRLGLYETFDGGAIYVMLLEGDATPLHMWAGRNTAFGLTSPGDLVRFTLTDEDFKGGVAKNMSNFQNLSLKLSS
jgi:hypothetical protein